MSKMTDELESKSIVYHDITRHDKGLHLFISSARLPLISLSVLYSCDS